MTAAFTFRMHDIYNSNHCKMIKREQRYISNRLHASFCCIRITWKIVDIVSSRQELLKETSQKNNMKVAIAADISI